MASDDATQRRPGLERLPPGTSHNFETPAKRINDGDELNFFLSSTAYRDLMLWLFQLNRSMFPTKTEDGGIIPCTLDSPPPYSDAINNLRAILNALSDLIEKAPPSTGPRRFGNVAFRDWFNLASQSADSLLRTHLSPTLHLYAPDDSDRSTALINELEPYLLGSFGSAQRLDYGTGHELSFLAFLGCLWKLSAFSDSEERAIVVGVIQPYLQLVRKLIMTYTLEPAGSHGVWGLDDHSFLPYIFGSAQLGPAIPATNDDPNSVPVPTEGSFATAPAPSTVTSKPTVAEYKDGNMYFAAIQFIYDVKRGPFWEHSPVLYDISGIKDGWGKVNKGMLKMWAAECLGKFPVVQHFGFGSLFRFEKDPGARGGGGGGGGVHGRSQPVKGAKSRDVPEPVGGAGRGVGTAAPWAKGGGQGGASAGGMGQMQASTGVPTMRAPWAGGGGSSRPAAPSPAGGMTLTAAPWASTQRPPPPAGPGMSPTPAPWASTARPPPPAVGSSTMAAPWAKKDTNR